MSKYCVRTIVGEIPISGGVFTNNESIKMGVAVAVILLFIGLAIQPSVAITKNGNNNPPDKPEIDGPGEGRPGIELNYIFYTRDPDGDDVSFYIDWGDGTSTGWTEYVPSEDLIMIGHTWDRIDEFPIRAKAKDIHGAEGEWSNLSIKISVEPKDYLFQTIIDIANNPEVKNLLEQYDTDLFKVDIDRSVYRKLLLRNPRLLFNMLFTKPSLTIDYLNRCYNRGIELTNIIGEDKALEMIETNGINNIAIIDELNYIIKNDDELSDRFAILKEINKELNPVTPFDDNPIICAISAIIAIGTLSLFLLLAAICEVFADLIMKYKILGYILGIPMVLLLPIFMVSSTLFLGLCIYIPEH